MVQVTSTTHVLVRALLHAEVRFRMRVSSEACVNVAAKELPSLFTPWFLLISSIHSEDIWNIQDQASGWSSAGSTTPVRFRMHSRESTSASPGRPWPASCLNQQFGHSFDRASTEQPTEGHSSTPALYFCRLRLAGNPYALL